MKRIAVRKIKENSVEDKEMESEESDEEDEESSEEWR